MKRALSLSIASVVPVVAAFGGCSSSNAVAPAGGSSSSGLEAGQGVAPDGSVLDGSSGEAGDNGTEAASDTTPYVASLNGYQVVPVALSTGAQGTGQFTLLADGVTLQYDISATGLSSTATSVNFHVGSAVDTGGISHQIVLGADASTSGGSLTVSGAITLSSSPQDEVDALPVGQLYVDISTTNDPGGEIRGQIVPPGATVMVANLTGAQEVPAVSSAYGAAAAFVVSSDGTTVQYHITPGANLTETVISGISNGAAIGGEPINPGAVNGLGSSTDGTIAISDAAPWFDGQEFVNISTQAHPSGEIRGQVIFPGETLFTSTLELTPAARANGSITQGGAEVILDPAQTGIRYEVDTTSGNLTGVFLNAGGFPGGAAATDAGTLEAGAAGAGGADASVEHTYQLTIVGTSATNEGTAPDASTLALPLAAADVALLDSNEAWVLVDTNSYMSGELEGVLVKQ